MDAYRKARTAEPVDDFAAVAPTPVAVAEKKTSRRTAVKTYGASAE